MAENKRLFNLDLARFNEIWDPPNCFNLQHEFRTNSVPLSNGLLTWPEESGDKWLIADFENKKTYDIKMVSDAGGNPSVEVWERARDEVQPVTSEDTEDILSHLHAAQGTNRGFIDLLTRLDLDQIDLDKLERAGLSEAGFSFEPVQEDLMTVYSRLREILASPQEWLLNLSSGDISTVNQYLQQFYVNVREIESFSLRVENPTETHATLLQEILQWCNEAKKPLGDITTFLSSRKVDQLETDVNVTVAKAVDQLNAETSRTKQHNEEVEKQESNRQQEFEQLKLELQNQLTEKPISQYKAIFQEQAKVHQKNARFWLGMAGVATFAFAVAFVLLSIFVKIESTALPGTLQNLFTKGFLLSPIYVWLNRSIKNHTAQKHLEVINTHRQNALETFDTFVAAAEGNRETRDAVLLAATEAIFDANQTGYLSTKATGPDSRSPVQQVIREIIPQKSSTKGG